MILIFPEQNSGGIVICGPGLLCTWRWFSRMAGQSSTLVLASSHLSGSGLPWHILAFLAFPLEIPSLSLSPILLICSQ